MSARPPYAQAARALLRDTLLDAAADLLREYSWSDISMAAIATRAGVSRQTLYNEFGSRDEFARAFALREADTFVRSVEPVIAAHAADPLLALHRAFEHFLQVAADSAMVRAIVLRDPGANDLFAQFTTRGGPVIELATERVAHAVLTHWPIVAAPQARLLAESLVRLAISHASLPTASAEASAQSVSALLEPFIVQALGLGVK